MHGLTLYLSRAGPGGEEVPPVFVDRGGVKIALQETYSRNSKGSLGLVLERVTSPPPPLMSQHPSMCSGRCCSSDMTIPQLNRVMPL